MENEDTKLPQKEGQGVDMEPINEFDQNHFYETDHIDKEHFAEQNRSKEDLGYQEISGTASMADRVIEEETIHELIDNSRRHDHHAAEAETGVGTHHNEHKSIENREDKALENGL